VGSGLCLLAQQCPALLGCAVEVPVGLQG
jgi:hypothetical protein